MKKWYVHFYTVTGQYIGRHTVLGEMPLAKIVHTMYHLRASGAIPGITPHPAQAIDIMVYFELEPSCPFILYPEEHLHDH